MENRVIQAVLLSLVVLFLYQTFLAPRPVQPPAPAAGTAPASAGVTTTPAPTPATPPAPAAGPQAPAAPTTEAAPVVAADRDVRIVVTTPHVRAEFSTRGAVLVSWTLTSYVGSDGKPIDLVPEGANGAIRPAFSLTTADAGVSERLANALFKPGTRNLLLQHLRKFRRAMWRARNHKLPVRMVHKAHGLDQHVIALARHK